MTDVRAVPCDYCDEGWCMETRSDPRGSDGTLTETWRCTACDGHGQVEIDLEPIEQEDLDEWPTPLSC